jgi:hypothetical protein
VPLSEEAKDKIATGLAVAAKEYADCKTADDVAAWMAKHFMAATYKYLGIFLVAYSKRHDVVEARDIAIARLG